MSNPALHAKVKEHWDNPDVESMYDKILFQLEVDLIKPHISPHSKILDAGCGEGEATVQYAGIEGVQIDAVDYSETRLQKAKINCKGCPNITFSNVDFLSDYSLKNDYDIIITQRFLINILDWSKQQKIILDLASRLNNNGTLVLFEGSQDGVDNLNALRALYGLQPIPVKWHNRFFNDIELESFLSDNGLHFCQNESLSTFYFMTRGIRPIFDSQLNWKSEFNKISAGKSVKDLLGMDNRFSRTKMWLITNKPG